MKDLEPILNVLCNYQAGFPLGPDEIGILSEWLHESKAHKDMYEKLIRKNGIQFIVGSVSGNIREKILVRLIELEDKNTNGHPVGSRPIILLVYIKL